MTAQTTTQRTAKHRQKRAEESARMRAALENIRMMVLWSVDLQDALSAIDSEASDALNPTDPTKTL